MRLWSNFAFEKDSWNSRVSSRISNSDYTIVRMCWCVRNLLFLSSVPQVIITFWRKERETFSQCIRHSDGGNRSWGRREAEKTKTDQKPIDLNHIWETYSLLYCSTLCENSDSVVLLGEIWRKMWGTKTKGKLKTFSSRWKWRFAENKTENVLQCFTMRSEFDKRYTEYILRSEISKMMNKLSLSLIID